jgi:hypothetical protein
VLAHGEHEQGPQQGQRVEQAAQHQAQDAQQQEQRSARQQGGRPAEVIEQYRGRRGRIIDVPYLYNAFYYPEIGRWGYENCRGYFIWLNV